MKRLTPVLLALSVLVMVQCRKEYTLDPPGSKVIGLDGTWSLYAVVQVDEIDLAKAERDISKFYVGDGTQEVLQMTFNSTDFTFEVINGEIGENYLPLAGTWVFDDDIFPTEIILKDTEGTETILSLRGPTRPQDQQLKFSFNRSCDFDGEILDYTGYRYELNRK